MSSDYVPPPTPTLLREKKKNPPACSPFIIAFVMLVRYTLFFWKDLFNYPRHRARWPPVPISKYNLKSKCYWALLNWLKKQMFMIHINVSIMQTVTLANETVVWKDCPLKGFNVFYLPRFTHSQKAGGPERSLSKANCLPQETISNSSWLLGNSLTGAVVSYKIQNEKTVTAKWSLWNCHPFHINCI